MRTRDYTLLTTLSLTLLTAAPASAQDDSPPPGVREELDSYRRQNDARIQELERELKALREDGAGDGADELDLEELIGEAESEAGAEEPPSPESFMQKALNTLNPRITVFGDFLGRLALSAHPLREDPTVRGRLLPSGEPNVKLDDRFNLREVELDFRAAVDPFAEAVLIAAFETEDPGDLGGEVVIEEGYVTLNFLPFGLIPKIGRFRSAFGRINRLHLHDLPQHSYPLPVQEFLGEEGFVEQGVSLRWLIPNPFGLSFEWTTEVVNGENAPILAGETSEHHSVISRMGYFQEIGESLSLDVGVSGLFGYNDPEARQKSILSGADLLIKWRPRKESQRWSVVAQGEVFYLDMEQTDRTLPPNLIHSEQHAFGAYAYLQVQGWQNWFAGVRYEYTEFASDDRSNMWKTSAYVSYYFSEFLRVRLGWEHTEWDYRPPKDASALALQAPANDALILQITFVFGSHPVEPYWQNR